MKKVANPHISDPSESSKWGFRNRRAEPGLCPQRLKQDCSSHGLAEPKYALRMIGSFKPAKPRADVVGLFDTVGHECSAAFTLRTGVRKQHGVAVRKQKFSIRAHALPVVTHTMQEDDRVAVVRCRADEPPLQLDAICRFYGDILELSIKPARGILGLLAPFDGDPQWVERHLA